jgi:hypothetical protein
MQGGESPITVPLAKDLDNWDGIIPSLEVWVHIVVQAELFPSSPLLVHGIGSLVGISLPDSFINNAEISAECIRLDNGQRRQGRV